MATPPSLETGILCIFLSFGKSTKPSFFEKAITKGTMNTPRIRDIIAPIICTCTCPNVRIVLSPFTYIMGIFDIILMNVLLDFSKPVHYQKLKLHQK